MTRLYNQAVVSAAAFQDGMLTADDYHAAYEAEAARLGVPLYAASRTRALSELYTAAELREQIRGRNGQIAERRRCLKAKGRGDDEMIDWFRGQVRLLSDGLTTRLRADRVAREQEASFAMAAE